MALRIKGGLRDGNGILNAQVQSDGSFIVPVDPEDRTIPKAPPAGFTFFNGVISFGTQVDGDGGEALTKIVIDDAGTQTIGITSRMGPLKNMVVKNFKLVGGRNEDVGNPASFIIMHFVGSNPVGGSGLQARLDGNPAGTYNDVLAGGSTATELVFTDATEDNLLRVAVTTTGAGIFSDLYWSCEIHPL